MNAGMDNIELEIRKFVAPEYLFGIDARLLVGQYCKKLGGRKILLATDSGIIQTQWFREVKDSLQENQIEYIVYSSISPNPRDHEVMLGAEQYNQNRCNMILAIGGGSVLDCAKGIGIIANNRGTICDFEGVDKIQNPMPPLVCIPTTSGTSADVSQFAIINNTKDRYKFAIISKAVVPDVALIDPMVLTTMDSYLTACTGMDALSHAFEAFVSNASSAFTDMYAMEAIRLINFNLPIAVSAPNDIQARGKMMLASLYAGLAFSNASLGCVHSLAHSLGGYLDLPHGECNAILLPHVVDFNYAEAENKYTKIAEIMGIANRDSSKTALMTYLFQLNQNLGIIERLQQKGVTPDVIPILARKAINDPCNATNPNPPSEADLEIIYKEAM
jgi:alcohol dehydrogenase class IV